MRSRNSSPTNRRHAQARKGAAKRKRTDRTIRSRSRRSGVAARENAIHERALALLSDLRRGVGTYSELLRKHRMDTRTAHWHLGRDLMGGAGGKPVRASKADRRVRDVLFPTSLGDVLIRTRSSRDATKLSEYFHDRYKLLRGRLSSPDFEAKWHGVRVAGKKLFVDAAAILEMANADALRVRELYASTTGAR